MADEELLALDRDPNTLTVSARAALREEVNRRGLESKVDQESALKGDHTPSDTEREPENAISPQPIRGWLRLLISYMILVPILQSLDLARQSVNLSPSTFETVHGLHAIYVSWIITALPAYLFMVYAGVGLLGKWRDSVKVAKISLMSGMIVSFLFQTAFGVILALPREATGLAHTSVFSLRAAVLVGFRILMGTLQAFYSALPNLIALLYLQRSSLVRLTYPNG
jgi:hypothetical protein